MQSRTRIAAYSAYALMHGTVPREKLVTQLAAWLKDSQNSRQTEYLVQDIAKKLADNGHMYITVTTASPLTESTKEHIVRFLCSNYKDIQTIEIHEVIQQKIIGGIRIDTPYGSLDATVKRSLIQIIKGVQR